MSARLNALAAIAFACLSSTAPAFAQERATVTARVAVADLNLATPAGKATLAGRLRRAETVACSNGDVTLAGLADSARCRREMQEDANVQVAALLHPDVQVAAAR